MEVEVFIMLVAGGRNRLTFGCLGNPNGLEYHVLAKLDDLTCELHECGTGLF